jgi:signal peptidase II
MKTGVKIILFCLTSLCFISCDRLTKNLAKEHLMNREPISYFHDTFRLEYIENTGAFLSWGDDLPNGVSFWLLSILPLVFLTALFVYVIRKSHEISFARMLPFAMIFSGGIGNIIDRLFFDRHVTDFLNIGFQNIRTGIFNVADVFVTTGVIIILITNFTSKSESRFLV